MVNQRRLFDLAWQISRVLKFENSHHKGPFFGLLDGQFHHYPGVLSRIYG
jgi:hypothetical protein